MLNGRLLFDISKASKQKHKSGLMRVSDCLRRELEPLMGDRYREVRWSDKRETYVAVDGDKSFKIDEKDVLLTGELFCEYERSGVERFLDEKGCRTYCIFHDAIPLQFPEFTWPHSVQRHPSYMKMLAKFSGAFAVSQHSAILLEEYWEWLEFQYAPSVKSIQLGADGVFEDSSEPRTNGDGRLQLLMLGILEKRKGQDYVLEACKGLWDEGLDFDLNVVGRANPYFGKPIEKALRRAAKDGYAVKLYGQVDDEELRELFSNADLMLFGSRAEGCGLPVLESLWRGVPVLCSQLRSVGESSRFGGCRMFEAGNVGALKEALQDYIEDRGQLEELTTGIRTEALPRWRDTVKEILNHMVSEGC
ncbi:MAG: glycosyltransferase [Verrucomicrobiota bacterium]